MAPATTTTTFMALYAAESAVPLPETDKDISSALDAYGAKHSKGTSKRMKDQHAEMLLGLSWLHMNHEEPRASSAPLPA